MVSLLIRKEVLRTKSDKFSIPCIFILLTFFTNKNYRILKNSFKFLENFLLEFCFQFAIKYTSLNLSKMKWPMKALSKSDLYDRPWDLDVPLLDVC